MGILPNYIGNESKKIGGEMEKSKEIEINEIRVEALPGSSLQNCFQRAMKLAIGEWETVVLAHNDNLYKIVPGNLVAAIEKLS